MRDRNPCKNARNQADIRRSGTLDAGDDVLAEIVGSATVVHPQSRASYPADHILRAGIAWAFEHLVSKWLHSTIPKDFSIHLTGEMTVRKRMFYVWGIGFLVVLGTLAWNVAARAGYESAAYDVIETDGNVEIRQYPDLVLVSTESNFEARGNDGSFMRLFGYISGKNESKQKIEMTTPVFMEPGKSEQKGKMSFVMPLSIAQAGAPEPNASNVTIGRRMGGRFAVIRFSGVMDVAKAEAHERKLREWMAARGLESEGIAERAGYDPPFTPGILRRNEVLIRIKPPMVAPQSDSPAGP